MKYIKKQKTIKALIQYQKTPNASFDGCPCKKEWGEQLLAEQGYICAYTMQRIRIDNMKREHFLPQSLYPELQLKHKNLLAVCKGNDKKGMSIKNQFADTRKANALLTLIDPRKKSCEQKIKYRNNGEIRVDDENLEKELVDNPATGHLSILNLNHDELVNGRKSAYDAVKLTLTKQAKNKAWNIGDIEKMLQHYQSLNKQGKFMEYCMYITFRLKKELKWRKNK